MIQDDICAHLADNGQGTVGTDIFAYQRDNPDNAVFVRVYDSPDGDWHGDSGLTFDEKPRLQIMVRGLSSLDTETKARAIHALLHCREVVIQNRRFHSMQCQQRPTPLGKDAQDRHMFVFNLEVQTS
jgi:hypothetical protein